METGAIPLEFLGGYPEMLAEVSVSGRRLHRAELDSRRELGERAAEAGYGLRELVGLYLRATRDEWNALPGLATGGGTGNVRRVGDAVLAAADAAVAALGEGHERAQRLAVRQEEAARREFIDDLLYGRSDLGRLAERAERFGLRLARGHAVAVACGAEAYDDVHPVVRRVEREILGRFGERDVLLATKEGRLVCIAPSSERTVVDAFAEVALRPGPGYHPARRVAMGREHADASGIVRSYEEALGALDFADRLDRWTQACPACGPRRPFSRGCQRLCRAGDRRQRN